MTNNSNQVRKTKIQLIIFLVMMIASVFTTLYFYSQLKKTKSDLEIKNTHLEAAQEDISSLNDSLETQQVLLAHLLDSINNIYVKDEAVKKRVSNAIGKDYKSAISFEREGFQLILNNEFEKAIEVFGASEKAYPSFHQVYEINRFLKKNRNLFNTPRGQKIIKRKIIKDFSWKAPSDLLEQLKSQTSP